MYLHSPTLPHTATQVPTSYVTINGAARRRMMLDTTVDYSVSKDAASSSDLAADVSSKAAGDAIASGLGSANGVSGATVASAVDATPTSAPSPEPTPGPTVAAASGSSSGSTSVGGSSGSSSSSSSGCFAATETVTLESGASKAISEVTVGDRILTVNAKGQQLYSDVAYLPHGKNAVKATFAVIATATGRDLKVTVNHYLPAGACALASPLPVVAASAVAVGDCVQTVSGREQVVSVSPVEGEGIYTAIAMEELLVVNGIVATPYGGINPALANVYYNIHRLAYKAYKAAASSSSALAGKTGALSFMQAATEGLWGALYRLAAPSV